MVRTSNAFRALAALTLATTSLAGCAKSDPADAAAQPQAKANASRSAIHNPQTDRSAVAVDLLAAVAAARGAIAGNDKTGAMTHVDAALGALPKIQKVGLVPIYTELSQQSVIGPVAAAKNMAARDAGAQENASSTMNNAAAPVAVKSVTTGFSRVLLDTSVARKMLDAARVAIGGGDLKAADKDLMTLEQSVVLESSAARMPLVRARENLSLASSAAARNDWGEVKAQLTSAANGLNDYAARAAATELADVRVLQQQIAKYAPNVESNHGDAASRINGWWVQAANLSDRT